MMVRTKPANAAGGRLIVALFALVTFVFQSYLTQTHIHFQPPASVVPKIAVTGHSTPANARVTLQQKVPEKAPSNEDPMKCPLCQAMGYAGHFVTPSAAAALLLPATTISVLPMAIAVLSPRETPSHIWQSRGPPRS